MLYLPFITDILTSRRSVRLSNRYIVKFAGDLSFFEKNIGSGLRVRLRNRESLLRLWICRLGVLITVALIS